MAVVTSELISEFCKYLTVGGMPLADYAGHDLTADARRFLDYKRLDEVGMPTMLGQAAGVLARHEHEHRLARLKALTQPKPLAELQMGQDFMMGSGRFTYVGFIKSDMALGGVLHLARCLQHDRKELSMFEGDEMVTPRLD